MTCFFNFEIYYLSISTFQTKKGQCSTVMTLTPNIWSVFYHHTHLLNDPGHFNKSGVCMCVCGGGEEWGGERGGERLKCTNVRILSFRSRPHFKESAMS